MECLFSCRLKWILITCQLLKSFGLEYIYHQRFRIKENWGKKFEPNHFAGIQQQSFRLKLTCHLLMKAKLFFLQNYSTQEQYPSFLFTKNVNFFRYLIITLVYGERIYGYKFKIKEIQTLWEFVTYFLLLTSSETFKIIILQNGKKFEKGFFSGDT